MARIGRAGVCYFKEPVKEGKRQKGGHNVNEGVTPHTGGASQLGRSAKDFWKDVQEVPCKFASRNWERR